MKIHASVISHPGKCRQKNEDNFCFHGIRLEGELTPKPLTLSAKTVSPVLMGLFDGMGGIKAGEVASYIAAETARCAIALLGQVTDYDALLLDICNRANAGACQEMRNVIRQRIGTTASMLCFEKERYHVCNIGDSPIFLFRDDQLMPIFREHTEKENFILLYGADAVPPKKKFRLTQHIGIFPEEMEIEPHISCDVLKPKDRFLITSDGLTDMVEEAEIAQILRSRKSPAKTVKILLQRALENGGKDNTTIICIDVK